MYSEKENKNPNSQLQTPDISAYIENEDVCRHQGGHLINRDGSVRGR